MTSAVLDLLVCPACRGPLTLVVSTREGDDIVSGTLTCAGCRRDYPVERSIPRFVPPENYAANFGFQWNRFRRTQLDSQTGVPVSRNRFFAQTNWTPETLRGRLVLDAGCGAGRFAEIALDAGATVVAIDYSSAVDACWANLGLHPRLHVLQADIYQLPFRPSTFDFVYSFGVLQHTPDAAAAFRALVPLARPGARVAVDLYPALRLNALWPKYWLRPLTARIAPERLFGWVERAVPVLLPVSDLIGRIPAVGRKLRYAIPVANYRGMLPLSDAQLREWAVLDTFDMLAPKHDHPESVDAVRSWFEAAGFENVEAFRSGLVVGRGRRP